MKDQSSTIFLSYLVAFFFFAIPLDNRVHAQLEQPVEHAEEIRFAYDYWRQLVEDQKKRDYRIPTAVELEAFVELFSLVFEGKTVDRTRLEASGISLQHRTMAKDPIVVLAAAEESSGEPYAMFVINYAAPKPWIVEAPHGLNDGGTGEQAIHLFFKMRARLLIINTAHRCSSEEVSGCSGQSVACSSDRTLHAYRASDPAHNTQTYFHAAHRYVVENEADSVVIQLHGFRSEVLKPLEIIVSDGTRIFRPAARSNHLASEWAEAWELEGRQIVSCNASEDYISLCGTQNVQARLINNTQDACTEGAKQTSNRFLHIEQSPSTRERSANEGHQTLAGVLQKVLDSGDIH